MWTETQAWRNTERHRCRQPAVVFLPWTSARAQWCHPSSLAAKPFPGRSVMAKGSLRPPGCIATAAADIWVGFPMSCYVPSYWVLTMQLWSPKSGLTLEVKQMWVMLRDLSKALCWSWALWLLCGPSLLSSPSLLILKTPVSSFVRSYWSCAWVSSFAYRITPAGTHPPTTIDWDHQSNSPLTTGSGKLIGLLRQEQKGLLASSLRDASQQGNVAILGISPWATAFLPQFSSCRFGHNSRLSCT